MMFCELHRAVLLCSQRAVIIKTDSQKRPYFRKSSYVMTNNISLDDVRKTHPFGTVGVAMVTPFIDDHRINFDKAIEIAHRLISLGCDSIIVNGTTGESPTTQPEEKLELVKHIVQAVGDKALIIHGSGTYDTAESVVFAQDAAKVGCHGLLVVTPYYSRPSQEGLYQHFTAVANATDLPIMLYDIPPRSIVPIAEDTLLRLSEHPNIKAVKDAKGDLSSGARIISQTSLQYYSGDDPLNLPWLSMGAQGFVSVIGHLVADRLRQMHTFYRNGDVTGALNIHNSVQPLFQAMSRLGGVAMTKASLDLLGLNIGPTRLPIVYPSTEEIALLEADLAQAGVL